MHVHLAKIFGLGNEEEKDPARLKIEISFFFSHNLFAQYLQKYKLAHLFINCSLMWDSRTSGVFPAPVEVSSPITGNTFKSTLWCALGLFFKSAPENEIVLTL